MEFVKVKEKDLCYKMLRHTSDRLKFSCHYRRMDFHIERKNGAATNPIPGNIYHRTPPGDSIFIPCQLN